MSDTSAIRAIRKEDVERNTPGNPVEIPYVQIQEESTERGQIGIKLPNGTKISVTEIHRTANKRSCFSCTLSRPIGAYRI